MGQSREVVCVPKVLGYIAAGKRQLKFPNHGVTSGTFFTEKLFPEGSLEHLYWKHVLFLIFLAFIALSVQSVPPVSSLKSKT